MLNNNFLNLKFWHLFHIRKMKSERGFPVHKMRGKEEINMGT